MGSKKNDIYVDILIVTEHVAAVEFYTYAINQHFVMILCV